MAYRTILSVAVLAASLATGAAQGQGGFEPVPNNQPAPPPPAAPGETQRQLDAKFRAYLPGQWTVTWNAMGMQYTSEVLYRPDGSLIGTLTVRQYTEIQYPVKGTWTVSGFDDTTFMLTTTLAGQGTGTDTMTVVDQNQLFSRTLQETARRIR